MFRFIHSADLHIGKPFGQFPGDLPALLRQARLDAIGRLAGLARARDAGVVVLAGDVWDSAEPHPGHVARALEAMAEAHDILWALLPGNHDPHRPGSVWEAVLRDGPANLRPLLDAAPVELTPGVAVLSAPCTARSTGLDPTEGFDRTATPEGALRLGIAHGPVIGFDEDGGADVIDARRAERAGLDYLALGDWHGAMEAGPRAWYSGTPEPDRFKADALGEALVVTLPAPGAAPQVERAVVGRYRWTRAALALTPGGDAPAAIRAAEPDWPRADLLLALTLSGEVALAEKAALEDFLKSMAHGLAHLKSDLDGLGVRRTAGDLDDIARAGPLREAAEALAADAADPALPEDRRAAARAALDMLYGWTAVEGGR